MPRTTKENKAIPRNTFDMQNTKDKWKLLKAFIPSQMSIKYEGRIIFSGKKVSETLSTIHPFLEKYLNIYPEKLKSRRRRRF